MGCLALNPDPMGSRQVPFLYYCSSTFGGIFYCVCLYQFGMAVLNPALWVGLNSGACYMLPTVAWGQSALCVLVTASFPSLSHKV